MCNKLRSNRDLFAIYTDCHINLIGYQFLNAFVLITTLTCFGFGLYEAYRAKKKALPLAAALHGFFLSISYGVILFGGIAFADRNVGLNVCHALGLSCIWLISHLHGDLHLGVIMSVDARTVATSKKYHSTLVRLNSVLVILTFLANLIGMTLPIVDQTISFSYLYAAIQIGISTINSVPRVGYAAMLRQILRKALTPANEKIYLPVIKLLNAVVQGTLVSLVIGLLAVFCWTFVPVVNSNVYVLYNLLITFGPMTGVVGLLDVRRGNEAAARRKPSKGSRTEAGTAAAGGGGPNQQFHSRSSGAMLEEQLPLGANKHEEPKQQEGPHLLWNPFTKANPALPPPHSSTSPDSVDSPTSQMQLVMFPSPSGGRTGGILKKVSIRLFIFVSRVR